MIRKTIAFTLFTIILMAVFGIFTWILRQLILHEDSAFIYWAASALVIGWLLWWQAERVWSNLQPKDALLETEPVAAGCVAAEAASQQDPTDRSTDKSTDRATSPSVQPDQSDHAKAEEIQVAMVAISPEATSVMESDMGPEIKPETAPLEVAPIEAISPPETMSEQFVVPEPAIGAEWSVPTHADLPPDRLIISPIDAEPVTEPEFEPVYEFELSPEPASSSEPVAPLATTPPVALDHAAEPEPESEPESEPVSEPVSDTGFEPTSEASLPEPTPLEPAIEAMAEPEPARGATPPEPPPASAATPPAIGVPLTWTTWGNLLQTPAPTPASAASPASTPAPTNTANVVPLAWTTWSAMQQAPPPESSTDALDPPPASSDSAGDESSS